MWRVLRARLGSIDGELSFDFVSIWPSMSVTTARLLDLSRNVERWYQLRKEILAPSDAKIELANLNLSLGAVCVRQFSHFSIDNHVEAAQCFISGHRYQPSTYSGR